MTSLAQLSGDSCRMPSAPRNRCSRRGRTNLAMHLDGVCQDGVGVAHAIGHGKQGAVVQGEISDQAADKRIRRTPCRQGHVVSAGHQGELAVALIVEGQRILRVVDFLVAVAGLHRRPIVHELRRVMDEVDGGVFLETAEQRLGTQRLLALRGREDGNMDRMISRQSRQVVRREQRGAEKALAVR